MSRCAFSGGINPAARQQLKTRIMRYLLCFYREKMVKINKPALT
jgi:hypothetical protein